MNHREHFSVAWAEGRKPSRAAIKVLSYSGFWPGTYVGAAVLCVSQVAGLDVATSVPSMTVAVLFACCTSWGAYVLDRVKLRNAWLDPADARADQHRHAFVVLHARGLRALILVLLGAAAGLGALLHPAMIALPFLALFSVLVYAGRPRARLPRPKDLFLLKNAYAAVGITGFAAVVAIAAASPGAGFEAFGRTARACVIPLSLSCAHLAVRVLADAVLCDLDDEHADRNFRTLTLPTQIGRMPAWNVALGCRLAIVAALVTIPSLPLMPRLAWAGVTALSSIVLRWSSPARVRDWVDLRFAVEACAVIVALHWLRGP